MTGGFHCTDCPTYPGEPYDDAWRIKAIEACLDMFLFNEGPAQASAVERFARKWFTRRGHTIEARGAACPECGHAPVTEDDVRSLAALIERIRGGARFTPEPSDLRQRRGAGDG